MRVMSIIDHPWTDSLNHAIWKTLGESLRDAGHEVDELDLHREHFNPVMNVDELAGYTAGRYIDPAVGRYQARLDRTDYLFLVFPVWWESAPALLKGFFDKVFLPGWAFAEEDFSPKLGHILGATVITTMGAPKAIHTSVESGICKGLLEACGVRRTQWINFLDVGNSTEKERSGWLNRVRTCASDLLCSE